ncbi:sucrose-6-phosphate hydrolase [Paenibacillus beijingensis]|uniref:Sucrose-6-phosphate hydrolase n=2 Tax=Paenibacillus beijingensis TaxID=1126833 RepID=A0A0D5NSD0_9BACL|nr:sucrose-6-phosphate hydrolase [Paenibacillus beijingensis]
MVARDYWRPLYHLSPTANWMNDPNGFCYFQGCYHLFYQHHPYSPLWDNMHWGHFRSRDLVTWEDLPIALAPGNDYDRDGCFSGSAMEKDGKLYLMYTGNVWTGPDRDKDLAQVQCLAVSGDGVFFDKWEGNPVIAQAPEGENIHPNHFRDPKVWKHGDDYYCVLGSRTLEHRGQIVLYKSADMMNWTYLGVAAGSEENGGYMWECPDLFEMGGRDVLVLSPQGVKPEGDKYHNLHQAGYMMGKLDYESGKFEHGPFKMLDYGFDFYAPQTMEDPEGRRILIAWMAMWESAMPEQARQWAGAMTLPRQLVMEEGKLRCRPVRELSRLRRGETAYENVVVKGETELDGVTGDCFEMELLLDVSEADRAGIKLRVGEASQEETVLTYNKEEGKLILDRNRSGQGPGGIRKAPVEPDGGLLRLHLFVDRSSVEVFVQDGEKVMTARIYPDERSKGVSFFAEGSMKIVRLQKWDLERSVGNPAPETNDATRLA